ncbi:hypothetical protein CEXT_69921 [Caerostris extrusa]|uniref:Uncharacterized protein n=1 Tax=Caerostris extrusa TaxID=172846 RepID=A0AAV4UHN8_CAEEX|nr:hypothetical protein CEXT_69921 [Caerostris extrusa]
MFRRISQMDDLLRTIAIFAENFEVDFPTNHQVRSTTLNGPSGPSGNSCFNYFKFFILMAAFLQTLRHMCLIKTAIIFLNRFDWFIYKYAKRYCLSEVDKNSRELAQIITEQVSGEVLQLLPAKSLRDDFLKMFQPLCYQILYFYASPSLHKPIFSLSDICWNSDGTLDALKTLKNLLQNPNIIHPRPFLIAWDNCMQDDFKRLWYEMNECEKADVARYAKEYGIKIEHAKKRNICFCHSKRKIPRTEVRFSGNIYSSVRWFRREEDLYARSYNSNMIPALKCLLGKLTLEMKKDKLESLFKPKDNDCKLKTSLNFVTPKIQEL